MDYDQINTASALQRYCDAIRSEEVICFDTEFVSEEHYRPELCLIQVQTGERSAIIDPYKTGDTSIFWQLLSDGERTVVVHAGREEMRFCARLAGRPLQNVFDVQLAAGFVGFEYPASLGNLVSKLLKKSIAKGETRTDWRRRPLSESQIKYALQDVVYLPEMYARLADEVDQRGRRAWLNEEVERMGKQIETAENEENWRRVSGSSGLAPRQLAVVRELWRWREAAAKEADLPARRLLRDDLIVELSRRGHSDIKRIRSVRGMERRNLQRHYEGIAAAIKRAKGLTDEQLPRKIFGARRAQSPLLTQFFSTAMAACCRANELAPAIVGNSDDVRDLLAYETSNRKDAEPPALARGWRGEVIGQLFHKLLGGKTALRVRRRTGNAPLEFIELD